MCGPKSTLILTRCIQMLKPLDYGDFIPCVFILSYLLQCPRKSYGCSSRTIGIQRMFARKLGSGWIYTDVLLIAHHGCLSSIRCGLWTPILSERRRRTSLTATLLSFYDCIAKFIRPQSKVEFALQKCFKMLVQYSYY